MHSIHIHADSCNMRCNAFLSVDLAFANTTTNVLIMQKGFRARHGRYSGEGRVSLLQEKLEHSVPI